MLNEADEDAPLLTGWRLMSHLPLASLHSVTSCAPVQCKNISTCHSIVGAPGGTIQKQEMVNV